MVGAGKQLGIGEGTKPTAVVLCLFPCRAWGEDQLC